MNLFSHLFVLDSLSFFSFDLQKSFFFLFFNFEFYFFRILKYDSNGNLLYILPQNEELLPLKVPHSITLIQDLDVICIADRENMKVVCTGAGLREVPSETNSVIAIQEPDMGRVFAVTSYNNKLFAVNGPSLPMVQIRGNK